MSVIILQWVAVQKRYKRTAEEKEFDVGPCNNFALMEGLAQELSI